MNKSRLILVLVSIIILVGQIVIIIVNHSKFSWSNDWGSLLSVIAAIL